MFRAPKAFATGLKYAALIMALPAAALAGPCDIVGGTATSVTVPAGGTYDVFNPADVEVRFDMFVENTTGALARCRIYFETNNANGNGRLRRAGGGDRLNFNIFRVNQTEDLILAPGQSPKDPRINVRLDPGETRRRRARVVIPAEQFVLPGTYRRNVRIITFQGNDETTLDQSVLRVQTAVEPQGRIFVTVMGPATTSSGKTASVDFATITEDEPPAVVNFLIQSNGNYRYQVTSENDVGGRGRLQLLQAPGDTGAFDDFIEYIVRSDGTEVPADGTQFPTGSAFTSTPSTGTQQTFEIDLESGPELRPGNFIEGKLSGRYEDTLTFTIVAE